MLRAESGAPSVKTNKTEGEIAAPGGLAKTESCRCEPQARQSLPLVFILSLILSFNAQRSALRPPRGARRMPHNPRRLSRIHLVRLTTGSWGHGFTNKEYQHQQGDDIRHGGQQIPIDLNTDAA